MPEISFVIPCYNQEHLIGEAIESALDQTVPAKEVIVVDDGSTDGSAEVIRSFGDKVRLIQQENQGRVGARATGIEAARSDWVALLDGDDLALPCRIEKTLEGIAENPGAVLIHGNGRKIVDGELEFRKVDTDWPKVKHPAVMTLREYFSKNLIFTSSASIHRETTLEVSSWWENLSKERAQDYGLFLLLSVHGDIVHVDEVLSAYRMHAGNDYGGREVARFRLGAVRAKENVADYCRATGKIGHLPADWRKILSSGRAHLGWTYYELGDLPAARAAYWKAVSHWPANGNALFYALLTSLPGPAVRWIRNLKRMSRQDGGDD